MIVLNCVCVCVPDAINKAAEAWGVDCKRYEIRESGKLCWPLKLA